MKNSRIISNRTTAKAVTRTKKPPTKSKSDTPSKASKEVEKRKLTRLFGNDKLTVNLAKSGISSFRQLAALPSQALLKRFDGKLSQPDQVALNAGQQLAQRMSVHIADRALSTALAQSPNGLWKAGGFPGKLPAHITPFCSCGCCDSIFSLKAYLFDLLDFLAHYWNIDLKDVEALLKRSFGDINNTEFNCETLNAPLPQARIAVEVLEVYLGGALPSNSTSWRTKFVDGLLRLITPREVQIAVLAGQAGTEPLTIVKLESQPNLPANFAAALQNWKTELGTLVLNLAGIDEADALLSDYTADYTGLAPNTLRRTDQQDNTPEEQRLREVTVKFEEAREATVRQWLADYRDTLVAATRKNLNALEANLFISLSSGACRTTTRLQEFVISVQQIVENIRSGEVSALGRPDVTARLTNKLHNATTLPLAEFAWVRLRDYETWLGYMYGWVYPEDVLSPLVNIIGDESFERVLKLLEANPLTAESARSIYLHAVTSLKAPGP